MANYFAPRYESEGSEQPVVHVELYFPDATGNSGLSAGIHYGGTTFLHPKTFRRNNWVFHSVPATELQVRRAREFCTRQAGTSFNYLGFFGPWFVNMSHSKRLDGLDTKRMPWYCSELVAYALYHAGVLTDEATVLARVHPNAAYHAIQTSCDTFLDCARTLKGRRLEL
jgi:hypothetical protein